MPESPKSGQITVATPSKWTSIATGRVVMWVGGTLYLFSIFPDGSVYHNTEQVHHAPSPEEAEAYAITACRQIAELFGFVPSTTHLVAPAAPVDS